MNYRARVGPNLPGNQIYKRAFACGRRAENTEYFTFICAE
jgi:hypothetical protein